MPKGDQEKDEQINRLILLAEKMVSDLDETVEDMRRILTGAAGNIEEEKDGRAG